MATLDSLLDFVMPKCPHLSVDIARHELRQACIRFCRKSGWDRRVLTSFNTVVGTPSYTLTPPTDTVISEIVSVKLDDETDLSPMRLDEIPADAETETAEPERYAASANATNLQLIYAPDAVYAVDVTVVVEPTRTATAISDNLAQRYGEDIACGALESLLLYPKKPWTDPNSAAYYKSRFDEAVLDAKSEIDEGFTGAPARVRCVFGMA